MRGCGGSMNEQVARKVLLARAIEITDSKRQVLSDDDRMYASRSANELAQWDASEQKSKLTPALFLQKRAEQILKRIEERTPAFSAFVTRQNWLHRIGNTLPVLGLLAGAFADRMTDPHRVDLLSAPLLLIILWNLVVYAVLLFWWVAPGSGTHPVSQSFMARWVNFKTSAPGKLRQPLAAAAATFAVEWLAISAPLTQARIQRTIHSSATGFALGALISLYVRGLLSQYQAGWESTFLNAQQVHAILSWLFMPAISVFQLSGFSIADVKALQLPQSGNPGAGALWVHLYAGTLVLLVILPRLLLALAARWRENRLSNHFPIDLGHPYFRKLTEKIDQDAPAVLRVFPYSFTVDETRDKGLNAVAGMLLGEQARVMLRPSTAYGQKPPAPPEPQQASTHAALANAGVTLTVVLFNLSATPERENHGAFLDCFMQADVRNFSVLIDESGYLDRVGTPAGGAARMQERIALWRAFCEQHSVRYSIVNLLNPQARKDDIELGLNAFTGAP